MLIDTNIFLEVLLEQEKSEQCKSFLREVLSGRKQVFLSTFSVDSIALCMLRKNIDKEKINLFLNSLLRYEGLKFYQLKIKDRMTALGFMKKYNLDYEDALILQAAIATNSEEIVSYDRHFDKIREIKRIEP